MESTSEQQQQQQQLKLMKLGDNANTAAASQVYNKNTVKPVNYLHEAQSDGLYCSIFNLLCCCFCLGIPAIVYSVQARERYRMGLVNEGKSKAKEARNLNIAGIIIGLVILASYFKFINDLWV